MARTAKTAAKRKAEMAMAKRAEDFRRREQALSEIVADYFDAAEQAEKARAAAQARAEKLRAQTDERIAELHTKAETAAADHEHRTDKAISRMFELGENAKVVAANTLGVPLSRIHETQRLTSKPSERKRQ
jgi:hypothetical protein